MAVEPVDAYQRYSPAPDPHLQATGNPIIDGISRLLVFLEKLLAPQPGLRVKRPFDMDDEELREAAFKVAIALVDGLGLILQSSFDGKTVDDPTWHRPWPTTVEMFVRSMFMTALDAFGTAAVSLGMNASVASTSNIRAIAECNVLIRWVLDGGTELEQRARVLAMTRRGIRQARGSLAHWERNATGPQEAAMIAYVRETLGATDVDLDAIVNRDRLVIPEPPDTAALFDLYLPGGYLSFALVSDMAAHPGPSPFFFYGQSRSGSTDWDYKGLCVERAFWITQACRIQVENCELAGSIFEWGDQEHVLKRIGDELAPLAAEAERRFTARRDPTRIWI